MKDDVWYVFSTEEPGVVFARMTYRVQGIEVEANTTVTSRVNAPFRLTPAVQTEMALKGVRDSIKKTHPGHERHDPDRGGLHLLEVWRTPAASAPKPEDEPQNLPSSAEAVAT